MSNPSFSNIDRWLFEWVEGNLSEEQIAQLKAFLLRHPELDVDKDMWEMAKVDFDTTVYPHKHKLVKRRRPIGLYTSLGFASIAVFLYLGIQSFINEPTFSSQQQLALRSTKQQPEPLDAVKKELNSRETKMPEQSISRDRYAAFKGESVGHTGNYLLQESQEINTLPNVAFGSDPMSTSVPNSPFEQSLISASSPNASIQYEENKISDEPREETISNIKESQVEANSSSEVVQSVEVDLELSKNNEFSAKDVSATKLSETAIEKGQQDKSGSTKSVKRLSNSGNHTSLKTRIHRFGRLVKGMLDNPVALKNRKDPYYHVPGMQALDVNYGSVGTLLATRVQTTARAQWLASEQQQLMGQLSIDNYSYALRGGIGMQLNYNYFGTGGIQNYGAAFIYSPKIAFGRNMVLEPSVRFKMGTKRLIGGQFEQGDLVEYDRMNAREFTNPGDEMKGEMLWYKDLGAGVMLNTKWFFVGFQADNLFEHFDNIYSNDLNNPRRAGRHLVATIGTDYESVRKNVCLSPYVVFQQKEALSELWAGTNLRYYWLTFGAAVSSNLEPAASLGMKFKHFMLTYNADYIYSQVTQKMGLSHQLTLRFLTNPSRSGQRLLNQ